jgi:hypothetical protein
VKCGIYTQRQSTWKELLEAHWDVLGAIDFTTIEVWTKIGLVTFCLLTDSYVLVLPDSLTVG